MVPVWCKFVEGFGRTGAAIARHVVKQIAELDAVEEEARGKSTDERVALRQEKAKPVFDELENRLQAQLPGLSGKTRLAGAIRHAQNRMPKARPCLRPVLVSGTDGWNLTTTFVNARSAPSRLGRKNHLFMGSTGAGKAAAIADTLIVRPQRSTKSIPRLGSHRCCNACQITRSTASVNSCLGTGSPKILKTRDDRTDTLDTLPNDQRSTGAEDRQECEHHSSCHSEYLVRTDLPYTVVKARPKIPLRTRTLWVMRHSRLQFHPTC